MTAPLARDTRYDLTGIKHIHGLTFELYRGSEDAMAWLESTQASYGLFRELITEKHATSIFSLRVRYSGQPSSSITDYEWGKVTFDNESDAVLFKLTFI